MYYGFDIGGTKIEFGAFTPSLDRVATERVPTPGNDYDLLVDAIVELVNKYDQKFDCQGMVGLGLPGMENADDNSVLTVNIPCANGRFLRQDVEAKLNRPVKLDNDANCFALSEAWDESLQDQPSVMGLILGTGFGGGLIYNGKVFSGRNHVLEKSVICGYPLMHGCYLVIIRHCFNVGAENRAVLITICQGGV